MPTRLIYLQLLSEQVQQVIHSHISPSPPSLLFLLATLVSFAILNFDLKIWRWRRLLVHWKLTCVIRSSDRVLTCSQDPRSYRFTFVSTGTAKSCKQKTSCYSSFAVWLLVLLMELTFAALGCQASRHRDLALLTSLVFCIRDQLFTCVWKEVKKIQDMTDPLKIQGRLI